MTNQENRVSLKEPQWYVRSAQALHRNRPFAVPIVAGLFLLEVSDILTLRWEPGSIAALWLGQCLLVFAVARRLHMAGWIKRRRLLTASVWVLNAAISATLATSALDSYRAYRDPDTWLRLESQPHRPSYAIELADDEYYLLDLSSDSDLKVRKAGLEESREAMRRLERQAKLSSEADYDYVMVSKFTNAGAKPLSIRLPITVSYEGIWQKDLAVPAPRDVQIAIRSLNPGEAFKMIIFSTDPDRYSSLAFPDAVPAKWDNSGQHPLRINYEGDNKIHSAMAPHVVVRGARVEPTPVSTPGPSNSAIPGKSW